MHLHHEHLLHNLQNSHFYSVLEQPSITHRHLAIVVHLRQSWKTIYRLSKHLYRFHRFQIHTLGSINAYCLQTLHYPVVCRNLSPLNDNLVHCHEKQWLNPIAAC